MLTIKQRDELIEIKGMAYGLSYMVDNPLGDAMLDIAEKIDAVLAEEEKKMKVDANLVGIQSVDPGFFTNE